MIDLENFFLTRGFLADCMARVGLFKDYEGHTGFQETVNSIFMTSIETLLHNFLIDLPDQIMGDAISNSPHSAFIGITPLLSAHMICRLEVLYETVRIPLREVLLLIFHCA